jgi:hypothetical protein
LSLLTNLDFKSTLSIIRIATPVCFAGNYLSWSSTLLP